MTVKTNRGRLGPYARYKDSGVEWLGGIPAGGEGMPLKRVAAIQNGADHKSIEVSEGYPVIGSGGPFAFASEYMHDGESVLLGRKGTVDRPLYVNGRFWTVDTMYWTRIADGTSARFVYYLATTIPFGFYSTNTALPSMTQSALSNHTIALPDLYEQRAISTFLNRETARIDALVARKERLITLLQERRTALITRAVTKGLDDAAPMKDSGVEWLGEIPAHWEVKHLKQIASHIVDCPHDTPTYADDGDHSVIRTSDLSEGHLDLTRTRRVDRHEFEKRIRRSPVQEGDIVYSREGERFGIAAIVPPRVSVCLGQRMMQFRIKSLWDPRFVMWQLNAKSVYQQASVDAGGATSPHVNVETIKNFWLCGPSQTEQQAIARFLDLETVRIDALVARIRTAITRLHELRTALISAAVTGKMDVREAVQ